MEHWSILRNIVNYVQYDRHPKKFTRLSVKAQDQINHKKIYGRLKHGKRLILELHFGNNPGKIRRECLDMYEGVQSAVLNTTRFDESSNLSTRYMTRTSKVNAEETFLCQTKGI